MARTPYQSSMLRSPDVTNELGQELSPKRIWTLLGGLRARVVGDTLELRGDAPGQAIKAPVRAASTANVDTAAPGASIDGVTLAVNDRVLLKNQSLPRLNGIYVWLGAAVAMTRATDMAASADVEPGTLVAVQEGTANLDTVWIVTANAPIVLDTSALTFAKVSSALVAPVDPDDNFKLTYGLDGNLAYSDDLILDAGSTYTDKEDFVTTNATPTVSDIEEMEINFVGVYDVTVWACGVSSGVGVCLFVRRSVFFLDDDGSLTEVVSNEVVGTDVDTITGVGGVVLGEDGAAPGTIQATTTGKAATSISWFLKIAVDFHRTAA